MRWKLIAALSLFSGVALAQNGTLNLIHTGDFHGHLVSRYNVRSDAQGHGKEGGLARIYSMVKGIRAEDPAHTLHFHTGDTIQGGAEVLYTRGQAMVNVLNRFGIDNFALGNWEWVYGVPRVNELFAGPNPQAPWGALAANAYYVTTAEDPTTPYPDKAGQRVLPPYTVRVIDGLRVGVLGMTTDRGPQVVGSKVTKGVKFTKGDAEVKQFIKVLRETEHCDVVVMISELGLANNIRLAEANPGLDVVLSSDMHEETLEPVITSTGTLVSEVGQDGTSMARIKLHYKNGKITRTQYKFYRVGEDIPEDPEIAAAVAEERKTFIAGPDFTTEHVNPFNGSKLQRPLDEIVGYTAIPLHRSNFSNEEMPGVIEGSSHDFLTDAFRAVANSDIGAIRGFRYGTHVPAGPITMEDLYHFVAIGPQIAIGTIKGQALKNQIENAANGSLDPNVAAWTGGWLFNFSGVTMNFNPYAPNGSRASNIQVNGAPLVLSKDYTYASYWYAGDPTMINVVPAANITVLKNADGSPLDGTEVVYRYLQALPFHTANPELNRITLTAPLPAPKYGFPEIQPLQGATP